MIIGKKYISEINIVDKKGGLLASITDKDIINHGSIEVHLEEKKHIGRFLIKKYFGKFLKREYEYPKRDRVLIEFDKDFWKDFKWGEE